ncbi:MAG: hypothetical protein GF364_18615 [Candidatus Lokiarchaeota archaeon]|nr:hypothetical protein [Candidatus Lokiarchaeota archaeon]
MPVEIFNEDDFKELSKISEHCRVKRSGDVVKLKLRTKKYLYVYKTSPQNADALINGIDCEIIEL